MQPKSKHASKALTLALHCRVHSKICNKCRTLLNCMKGGGGDVALVFKVQRQSYKRDNYNRETYCLICHSPDNLIQERRTLQASTYLKKDNSSHSQFQAFKTFNKSSRLRNSSKFQLAALRWIHREHSSIRLYRLFQKRHLFYRL